MLSQTLKPVCKFDFLFYIHGLQNLRKPILPICMRFCMGYRAAGRTQTDTTRPQKVSVRTITMLLPFVLVKSFCFSHCIMHEVLKYLTFF